MLHKGTESKQPSKTQKGWEKGMSGILHKTETEQHQGKEGFLKQDLAACTRFQSPMLLIATLTGQYRHEE